MDAVGAPSLDLLRQTVPCPTPRGHLHHLPTGRRLPAPCKRQACSVCGPLEAWVRARAIASADPARFIVATYPPGDWDGLTFEKHRAKVKRFRFTLEELFGPIQWAWTVEVGAGGNPHINLLQKGPSKLPQPVLQAKWGGIVHVSRIKRASASGRYAMKEAMRVSGYALKEAGGKLDDHLRLNGGRLAHWSRGYFDGRRFDDVRRDLAGDSGSEWEWHPEQVTAEGVPETWASRGRMLSDALRSRSGAS